MEDKDKSALLRLLAVLRASRQNGGNQQDVVRRFISESIAQQQEQCASMASAPLPAHGNEEAMVKRLIAEALKEKQEEEKVKKPDVTTVTSLNDVLQTLVKYVSVQSDHVVSKKSELEDEKERRLKIERENEELKRQIAEMSQKKSQNSGDQNKGDDLSLLLEKMLQGLNVDEGVFKANSKTGGNEKSYPCPAWFPGSSKECDTLNNFENTATKEKMLEKDLLQQLSAPKPHSNQMPNVPNFSVGYSNMDSHPYFHQQIPEFNSPMHPVYCRPNVPPPLMNINNSGSPGNFPPPQFPYPANNFNGPPGYNRMSHQQKPPQRVNNFQQNFHQGPGQVRFTNARMPNLPNHTGQRPDKVNKSQCSNKPNPGQDQKTLKKQANTQKNQNEKNHGQQNPNQKNPGQQNPKQKNPGQQNQNQKNPGQQNPKQKNPGQQNQNQKNPGQQNPKQKNAGQENSNQKNHGQQNPSNKSGGKPNRDQKDLGLPCNSAYEKGKTNNVNIDKKSAEVARNSGSQNSPSKASNQPDSINLSEQDLKNVKLAINAKKQADDSVKQNTVFKKKKNKPAPIIGAQGEDDEEDNNDSKETQGNNGNEETKKKKKNKNKNQNSSNATEESSNPEAGSGDNFKVFAGANFPTMSDVNSGKLTLTQPVKGILMIAMENNETITETPKVVKDMIVFHEKYPKGKLIILH